MLTKSEVLFLIRVLKKVQWLRVLSGGSDELDCKLNSMIQKLQRQLQFIEFGTPK